MIDEDGSPYKNDKRSAFLPFVELPGRVSTPLELAIHLAGDKVEQEMLQTHGWRVREAHEVASQPSQFRHYVQGSRGEFGCAKPAYVQLQTSWISDRTAGLSCLRSSRDHPEHGAAVSTLSEKTTLPLLIGYTVTHYSR